MKITNAYLQLHFIVLIWGFTAVLGLLISLPPVEVVFYRTLFSFMGLFVLLKFNKVSFNVEKKEVLYLLGTGAIIAIHWILFFLAARLSNISVCLVGMATLSLWTGLLEPIMTKKKFSIFEPLLGILAIVGITIVFNAAIDFWLGFAVAVLSAFMSAIFTILNGRFVKKHDYNIINFYEMVGACLSIVLFFPFYSVFFTTEGLQLELNVSDTFYLLVLALLCTVYAYSVSIKLMHKLTAFTINLTVNLEPIYGIILAFLIFKETEKMEANFYWGSSVILLSVLLHPIVDKWVIKKAEKRATDKSALLQ